MDKKPAKVSNTLDPHTMIRTPRKASESANVSIRDMANSESADEEGALALTGEKQTSTMAKPRQTPSNDRNFSQNLSAGMSCRATEFDNESEDNGRFTTPCPTRSASGTGRRLLRSNHLDKRSNHLDERFDNKKSSGTMRETTFAEMGNMNIGNSENENAPIRKSTRERKPAIPRGETPTSNDRKVSGASVASYSAASRSAPTIKQELPPTKKKTPGRGQNWRLGLGKKGKQGAQSKSGQSSAVAVPSSQSQSKGRSQESEDPHSGQKKGATRKSRAKSISTGEADTSGSQRQGLNRGSAPTNRKTNNKAISLDDTEGEGGHEISKQSAHTKAQLQSAKVPEHMPQASSSGKQSMNLKASAKPMATPYPPIMRERGLSIEFSEQSEDERLLHTSGGKSAIKVQQLAAKMSGKGFLNEDMELSEQEGVEENDASGKERSNVYKAPESDSLQKLPRRQVQKEESEFEEEVSDDEDSTNERAQLDESEDEDRISEDEDSSTERVQVVESEDDDSTHERDQQQESGEEDSDEEQEEEYEAGDEYEEDHDEDMHAQDFEEDNAEVQNDEAQNFGQPHQQAFNGQADQFGRYAPLPMNAAQLAAVQEEQRQRARFGAHDVEMDPRAGWGDYLQEQQQVNHPHLRAVYHWVEHQPGLGLGWEDVNREDEEQFPVQNRGGVSNAQSLLEHMVNNEYPAVPNQLPLGGSIPVHGAEQRDDDGNSRRAQVALNIFKNLQKKRVIQEEDDIMEGEEAPRRNRQKQSQATKQAPKQAPSQTPSQAPNQGPSQDLPNQNTGRLPLTLLQRAKSDIDPAPFSNVRVNRGLAKTNDKGCSFCLFECDTGVSDDRVWLPVQAAAGFCEDCLASTNSFNSLFDSIVNQPDSGYNYVEDPERDNRPQLLIEAMENDYRGESEAISGRKIFGTAAEREGLGLAFEQVLGSTRKVYSKDDGKEVTKYMGVQFCRGCPWRQVDCRTARICDPCRREKLTIANHCHEEFEPITESDPVTEVLSVRRAAGHPKNCMVCPNRASASCKGCPLKVCADCEGLLTSMCKGHLNNLFYYHERAHLRNDAFLLRSDGGGY